jgi:hypothetical protein
LVLVQASHMAYQPAESFAIMHATLNRIQICMDWYSGFAAA